MNCNGAECDTCASLHCIEHAHPALLLLIAKLSIASVFNRSGSTFHFFCDRVDSRAHIQSNAKFVKNRKRFFSCAYFHSFWPVCNQKNGAVSITTRNLSGFTQKTDLATTQWIRFWLRAATEDSAWVSSNRSLSTSRCQNSSSRHAETWRKPM